MKKLVKNFPLTSLGEYDDVAFYDGRYYLANGTLKSISEDGKDMISYGEFDGNLDKSLVFFKNEKFDIGVFCFNEGEGLIGAVFNNKKFEKDRFKKEGEVEEKISSVNYFEKKRFQGVKELKNIEKSVVLRSESFHDFKGYEEISSIIALTHSNTLEVYKIDPEREEFFNLIRSHCLKSNFYDGYQREEEYRKLGILLEKKIIVVGSIFRKNWDTEILGSVQFLKFHDDMSFEAIGEVDLSQYRMKNFGVFEFISKENQDFFLLMDYSKKCKIVLVEIKEEEDLKNSITLVIEGDIVNSVNWLKRGIKVKVGGEESLIGVDKNLNLVKINLISE